MATVVLREGKEKSLWRRHPWVYDSAIASTSGRLSLGATVNVMSHDGQFLAKGAYSPQSVLRVRIWSFDEHQVVDHAFFKNKIQRAIDLRKNAGLGQNPQGALRWIFGEADFLPGCIVDQYANVLVVQFLSAGVEHWKEAIIKALEIHFPDHAIYERSDASGRKREGLENRAGWIKPPAENTETKVCIVEHGLSYWVDVATGHKTGWYLDQANHRQLCAELLKTIKSSSLRVLNTFCYTGGFSLSCLQAAASQQKQIHLYSVDASAEALSLAQQNLELNQFDLSQQQLQWIQSDVFDFLKKIRPPKGQPENPEQGFDLIVLDPPKFAASSKQLEQAARAYKQINLEALRLLKKGGVLLTFSCSGAMSADLFRKVVAGAVADARVNCVLEQTLSQPLDHPIMMSFPEGEYLKGLVLRRVED